MTSVKIALVGADAFLLGMTWLWFQAIREQGLGALEVIVLGASVIFAAWLGCVAALMHFGGDR